MKFQLVPDHDVIKQLNEAVPEIAAQIAPGEGPYSTLSNFALILRDGVTNDSISPETLAKAFDFINTTSEFADIELQNQLVVGIFELLSDSEKVREVATTQLRDPALSLFQRTIKGWVGDEQ